MLLSALFLTSCKSVEEIRTETEVVYIDRCLVDTVLRVEADTASMQALLECDSLGNVLMTELATLQGQRVSVAPKIVYREVVGKDGTVRRAAYMSVVALADSLQQQISILEEQIRSERKTDEQKKENVGKQPLSTFHIGSLMGLILAIIMIIFYKK